MDPLTHSSKSSDIGIDSDASSTDGLQNSIDTTEFEWDESSFSRLVGLTDDDFPVSSSGLNEDAFEPEEFLLDEDEEREVDSSSRGDILSDQELFDDPHENSTPKTLSGNPWAKLAMVGVGLLTVFGTAGFFLNQIMTAGSKIGSDNAADPTPEVSPTTSEEAALDNTEGQLKTELALAQQAEELKAAEELANQPRDNAAQPQEGTENAAPPASPPASPPAPPPAQQVSTTRPASPSPVVVRPQPLPRTPIAPPVSATPSPATRSASQTSEPVSSVEQLNNSMVQWRVLAQVGSYGQTFAAPERMGTPETSSALMSSISASPMRPLSAQQPAPATVSPVNGSTPSLPQQPALPGYSAQPDAQPEVQPAPPVAQTNGSLLPEYAQQPVEWSQPYLTELESRVLQGEPIRQVTAGTSVAATLTSPLVWAEDADVDPRIVVTLDEPIFDSAGEVVVPQGASLIFMLSSVMENGLVLASAVAVINDEMVNLPENVVTLRGSDGPLIAENWFDYGPEIASMDFSTLLFGAIAKVGEILNLPEEETSQTTVGPISSSSSSSTRRDPNILGAVMEGAATPVLEQIIDRNQQAVQEFQEQEEVWYLPVGEQVKVFVGQLLQF